jgi:hypothetical protein
LIPKYYHVLQLAAGDQRSGGVTYHAAVRIGGLDFLRSVISELMAQTLTPSEAMIQVSSIVTSLSGKLHREDVETMCEEVLLAMPPGALDEHATRLSLCLCAIIGSFGVTSQETEYVAAGGGGGGMMSMMGMLAGGMGSMGGLDELKPRKKTPPKPRDWCWWVLRSLDVHAAFRIDLAELLGTGRVQDARHGRLAQAGAGGGLGRRAGAGARGRGRRGHGGGGGGFAGMGGDDGDMLDFESLLGGGEGRSGGGGFKPVSAVMEALAEASERAAEHGYYDYLRVMPLLKSHRAQRHAELRIAEDPVRILRTRKCEPLLLI